MLQENFLTELELQIKKNFKSSWMVFYETYCNGFFVEYVLYVEEREKLPSIVQIIDNNKIGNN